MNLIANYIAGILLILLIIYLAVSNKKIMRYSLVIIFDNDYKNVLLIKRNKEPFTNTLNGIGGKIDIFDITVEQGAMREVREETCLSEREFDYVKPLTKETFPYGVELNVFYAKMKPNVYPVQMESEELIWKPVNELLDVTNDNLAGNGNLPYFIYSALKQEGIK